MIIPISVDPREPTEKFIRRLIHDHDRAELLKALLRETLYQSVRYELLGDPRYAFSEKDARRDEYRIREAVEPIAEAAFKCAVTQAAKGRRWSPRAVLSRIHRETDDLATLSSWSVRDKLRSWLTCGIKNVFAKGRFSDKPKAAPRTIARLEIPGGPWWDALADPAHPVVIRAADIFEEVVRQATDDPEGTNASRKFAGNLIEALEKNDLRRARKQQTVKAATAGTIFTGALAGVEFIEPLHQLLPATAAVGAVSLAFVLWLTSRTRGTPTGAEISELSIAIDSIRDWVINVEELPEGEEKYLLEVCKEQLLPSLESFEVALLKAVLQRISGLLNDRAERRPSYQPAKLDSALSELHRLIDPRLPADQLPTGQRQPTADEVKGRLREIGAAAHEVDSPPGPDSGNADTWDPLRDAALRNTSLIGAAGATEWIAGPADTGLAGDPGTVEFLVSTAVEQLPPGQVPRFISGPLVQTLERLQREVGFTPDVTRERIVDIVLRALESQRGTARAGRLVGPLFGYLNGERRPPTIGIYMTVAVLAQLMLGLNDRQNRLVRIFMYHYVLVGVWRLLRQDGVAFDAPVRQVASVAAGNAGMNLWQLLPEQDSSAQGAEVVRMLRTLMVTSVPDLPLTEAGAATILQALGLPYREARAALTVLSEAGALADVWTTDARDLARIESAAAVAVIAAESAPDQIAVRLYNAAISLQGIAEPQAAGPLRARLLLCGLGLYWSLVLGTDLLDSLDRLEGLDCAFDFVREVGQYQAEGHEQAQSWSSVIELAGLLSELPKLLPHERAALRPGAARLADAASRVRLAGVAVSRDVGVRELAEATVRAVDALRPSGASPQTDEIEPRMLDTAALIRSIFEDILDPAEWGLGEIIDQLAEGRSHPREEFLRRYQSLVEPAGSRLGTGPPVAAGVASESEWEAIEAFLLHDPGTIIPALLQEFPRQL